MNNRFVNPYNFIGFPKTKAQKYSDSDRHTGVIEYTLTTKSPLFIPNSSNDNAFDLEKNCKGHKSYDFYSYTDLTGVYIDEKDANSKYSVPVIPGSEVRGMIRSVYETLTDSCMGLLNDVHPVKRVSAKFNPGLLSFENGVLCLIKANSLRIDRHKCKNRSDGAFVSFEMPEKVYEHGREFYKKIEKYSFEEDCFEYIGYLIRWGLGVRKANYHVFYDANEDTYAADKLNPTEIKRIMNDVVVSYKEQPSIDKTNEKDYDVYLKAFNDFIKNKNGFFPINYAKVEGNLYISPTTYSKEVSKNSIGDLTFFKPCVNDCCPACDLFGRVGDNSKGSSIRFSDLIVNNKDNEEYYCDVVTLNNLNSPKLGNMEFYLERPTDADYWSYDYLVKNRHLKLYNAVLRGRKYYWHFPNDVILNKEVVRTNLNKTVRPVKRNTSFSGKLYFDGISEKQLKQLIYILNTSKENLELKLGMGKPLGLGSVALRVDRVKTRDISYKNNEVSYAENDYDFNNVNYDDAQLSKNVEAEFKKIANFDSVPKDLEVCYPKTTESDDKGFEWFIANHYENGLIRMIPNREQMIINESLPYILDNDISMPCLNKAKSKNSSSDKKDGSNNSGKFNNSNKQKNGANGYQGNHKKNNHNKNYNNNHKSNYHDEKKKWR